MSKIFEALISANDLQAMSKKKLFDEMLRSFKKLGLTHNNELKAVILDIQTYEHLVDRLEELEEMQEDIQLAHNLSDRLQLPKENWLEKPDQTSRMEFLRSMEKGSST
jgi:PHD/YefM family antitoxin component YafN of YafNO toxin-antitoxin module